MTIALWGDLKYGRTTHSLIFALAKFGADDIILSQSRPGSAGNISAQTGNGIRRRIGEIRKNHKQNQKGASLWMLLISPPNKPHQLTMMPGIDLGSDNESRRRCSLCNQTTAGTVHQRRKARTFQFPIGRPEN